MNANPENTMNDADRIVDVELRPTGTDKIWAILSHLSLFSAIGFLFFPLIVYLAMKDDSPFAAEHAKEALNFHISVILYSVMAALLCFVLIGFVLLGIISLATIVLAIVAALRVSDNKAYRYPLTLRLIK